MPYERHSPTFAPDCPRSVATFPPSRASSPAERTTPAETIRRLNVRFMSFIPSDGLTACLADLEVADQFRYVLHLLEAVNHLQRIVDLLGRQLRLRHQRPVLRVDVAPLDVA